ncbi:MAG: hypothetical protein ACOY94_11790 [Bacillota bacterium]
MGRSIRLVAAVLLMLGAVVYLWPVEGRIWREGQVNRLALVNAGGRYETDGRPAIAEALVGARLDRFRRLLNPLTGRPCRPRDLSFLIESGWVDLRLHCPDGLFLDYLPWPGVGR